MRILLLSLCLIAVTASPARTYKRTYGRKMDNMQPQDAKEKNVNIMEENLKLQDVKEKNVRMTEEKVELQDIKEIDVMKTEEKESVPLDIKQKISKKIEDNIEPQDVKESNAKKIDGKENEFLDLKGKNAKKIEEKEPNAGKGTGENSPRSYDHLSIVSSTVATLSDKPQEITPHVISPPQINIGWPQGASNVTPKKGMDEKSSSDKKHTDNKNTVNIYINFNDDDDEDYDIHYECKDGSKRVNGKCDYERKEKCQDGEAMVGRVCTPIYMSISNGQVTN